MNKYTIVALPKQDILNKLNTIRDYFYQNNFRYTNKPLKDNSHITLGQVSIKEEKEILNFKTKITNTIKDIIPFEIMYTEVTNKEHTWIYNNPDLIQKYPNGCSRVALLFKNQKLKDLADICINTAISLGINDTDEYANNIRNSQPETLQKPFTIDYVADHMNICNYSRLEKAQEAINYFKTNFTGGIIIDSIGLVSKDQELIRNIKLQS